MAPGSLRLTAPSPHGRAVPALFPAEGRSRSRPTPAPAQPAALPLLLLALPAICQGNDSQWGAAWRLGPPSVRRPAGERRRAGGGARLRRRRRRGAAMKVTAAPPAGARLCPRWGDEGREKGGDVVFAGARIGTLVGWVAPPHSPHAARPALRAPGGILRGSGPGPASLRGLRWFSGLERAWGCCLRPSSDSTRRLVGL